MHLLSIKKCKIYLLFVDLVLKDIEAKCACDFREKTFLY